MRQPLVAGNWKMYTYPKTAKELAKAIKKDLGECDWADIMVFPPFTSISLVVDELQGTKIEVGGQNVYWENEGAFTGEISPLMLINSGCGSVIIGHSERRAYFNLKNEDVLKQTKAADSAGLKPIVCVGETLEQREKGITEDIIKKQILEGIGDIKDLKNITIAYEPVWAIGTGKTATPQQAQEVHKFIRNLVKDNWDESTSNSIRILYGGSVKPENAKDLWNNDDIDGFLIGGASLKADSFSKITEAVK